MRVLLVEDDAALSAALMRALQDQAFAVDHVGTGEEALDRAAVNAYDVVLLDRGLPGRSGDDVCRELIAQAVPPRILMLTAADAVHDRVAGLDIGADDYLTKPFALAELLARVRALARRPPRSMAPVLERGGLRLDGNRRTVERDGRPVGLTRKEFGVLEELLRAEGTVVSAEQLLERVWDENADPFTNAIRITMMTLRRKLGEPAVIETVTGVGYRLT